MSISTLLGLSRYPLPVARSTISPISPPKTILPRSHHDGLDSSFVSRVVNPSFSNTIVWSLFRFRPLISPGVITWRSGPAFDGAGRDRPDFHVFLRPLN